MTPVLVMKLIVPGTGGVSTIASRQSFSFPLSKISSPGIRQVAHKELDKFLNSATNITCELPDEEVEPRKLFATELRNLAEMVEDGSRIQESTIYDETDSQTLVIKLRRPE